jgi:hypothetical protein
MELDMEQYRGHIISGARDLAYLRALDVLRPRNPDDYDGEYKDTSSQES